jgi:hypothetical protein
MEALFAIVGVLAYAIVAVSLVVVAGKVVWNIGLPYAMLREHARGVHRGWSIFPLIEIVPLLVAIGLSYLVGGQGPISPRSLALWGFTAIFGSYFHFALVPYLYGICVWLRRNRHIGT